MRQTVKIYYTNKQVCLEGIEESSFSKSPLKPALYVDEIKKRLSSPNDMVEIVDNKK